MSTRARDRERSSAKFKIVKLKMATAPSASILLLSGSAKAKRKCYTREFKLTAVNHYRENNLYQMFKRFSLNTRTIFKVDRWRGEAEEDEGKKQAHGNSKETCISRNGTEIYREYKSYYRRGRSLSISINERGSNYEQQVIIFCCKLDVTRVTLVHHNWYSIASVYFLENINQCLTIFHKAAQYDWEDGQRFKLKLTWLLQTYVVASVC